MRADGRPSGPTVERVIPVGSMMPGLARTLASSSENLRSGSIGLRVLARVTCAAMERLLARLERRYGRYAPENLIFWVVGLSGAIHVLVFAVPDVLPLLWFDPNAVLHGEVWRILTFLFAPVGPVNLWGLLWTGLGLWLLHTMGTSLEQQWGALRFALFCFAGALGTLAAGFLV